MKDFIQYFIAPIAVAISLFSLSSVSSLESRTSVNSAVISIIKDDLDKINNKLDTIVTRGCK